jgi:hypothetical protein
LKRLANLSTRDLFPGGFFYLAIICLFLSLGFIILSNSVWDYDFWWHIATGRYIVENGHIPDSDPFSFTSILPENSNLYPDRERFILSQYWLAQIISYFLYSRLGPMGIGALRAILLLGALYAMFRALSSRGAFPYINFLALFLAACNLLRFFGDRPVLYTISFSVISFVMVDDYVRERSRAFYLLPVLLLVWANLHGGFIMGAAIILIFALAEAIKLLFQKSGFSTREKIIFFSVIFIALGASGINPNGFFGFQIAFSDEFAPFYSGIQEYESPFYVYKMKFSSPDYGFITALFLLPVVLILRNKKFNRTHLILLLCLAAGSVSAGRYTVYYGLISSLVLGNELSLWLKEHEAKILIRQVHLNAVFSIVMLASSLLYLSAKSNLYAFKMKESGWTVPKAAADFLQENHIKGNMLNDMGSGGYLAWRLYPEVKTFIDTRALNYTVMKEYSWLMKTTESVRNASLPAGRLPLWKRLLENYNIKVIVFSPVDIYGNVLPLVFKLLDDDSWVPVSAQVMAVVFVKNTPENRQIIEKFKLTNDQVYNMMILRISLPAQLYRQNPYLLESLGDIFIKMGRREDAIKAYEYSLKRLPNNPRVEEKLNRIKRENDEVKNE